MVFKLIQYFQKKPFLINGISPYDLDKFIKPSFQKTAVLTLEDKKQACLLIDLLRLLVQENKVNIDKQKIVLFNATFNTLNHKMLFQAIEQNLTKEYNLINFVYNRLEKKECAIQILNKFEEQIIQDYFNKY